MQVRANIEYLLGPYEDHLSLRCHRDTPGLGGSGWHYAGSSGHDDKVGMPSLTDLHVGGVNSAVGPPHAPHQPSQGRARGDDERPRLYGGPMASVKQIQVTFDCAEPERVARFWCEVLGYVVPPPPEGFATWDDFDRALPPEDQGSWFACVDPSGVGPRLFFQRVPEGKVVKNRLHLDVRVGTGLVGEERLAVLEAECARLVALGAVRVRLLPADDENESCIVMQDIEGNEFDLD
jgi:Glyoxalase-like domain